MVLKKAIASHCTLLSGSVPGMSNSPYFSSKSLKAFVEKIVMEFGAYNDNFCRFREGASELGTQDPPFRDYHSKSLLNNYS